MADFDLITVEVAYALPHKQKIIALLVAPGTTALQAVDGTLFKACDGLDFG